LGQAIRLAHRKLALLAEADDIVGYRLYLDLLGGRSRQKPSRQRDRRGSGALSLDLAAEGARSRWSRRAIPGSTVSTLVFELIDREQRRDWSAVEITVAPGITAMQAATSRRRPLGHDFCAVSLSDC
jgi:cobalt-precorrin 5A hydrolase/precorrin-3B C17-methyltransferase